MRTLGTKCFGCGKDKDSLTNSLMQCGGCHAMTYCSKDCQQKHWDEHKEFCKMIRHCPECFSFDYQGYAYRRFQVYEAIKTIPKDNIAERDRIEMTFTRDLLVKDFEDLQSLQSTLGSDYFSFESLSSMKESLLMAPDLGHSKQGKSIAFMHIPQAPLMLFRCCYLLLKKCERSKSKALATRKKWCHDIARDFFRGFSQILYHREAAIQFGRLLEDDLPTMRPAKLPTTTGVDACLLELLVRCMIEFEDIADDIQGLTWLCVGLLAIHIENDPSIHSQIVQQILNRVKAAGEAHIVDPLFIYAKKHAQHSLVT